ncbi:hypothetical protein M1466_03400 [Candidatus Dependentiae bacterium]|nr:hypothetical protein [Candidatus Dependentiae bacterium]
MSASTQGNAETACKQRPIFYQGNLTSLCKAAEEEITLLHCGQKIRTNDGIFTIKLEPRWHSLIFLFANPVSLVAHGDENVINYLTIKQADAQHAYELTPFIDEDTSVQQWHSKKIALPQSFKAQEKDRCVIPLNCILIPIPGSYFLQQQEIIALHVQPVKAALSTFLLPEPLVDSAIKKTDLQRTYKAAHVVLMNLRPIHESQKIYRVHHDQLTVEQTR